MLYFSRRIRAVKVLMCGNHPSNRGGMTSVISQLRSYNWEDKGIQLKFIPTYYPANKLYKTVYFSISFFRVCIALLTYKPDIVHMHMSYKGSFYRKYMIHRLCKRFNIKDIIHLHGSEFEKWYYETDEKNQNKIRTLLRECDAFFVLGEKWKKIVESIEPAVNVIVVPNAVAIPKCTVRWSDDQFRLLYMGVLIPRKGIDKLLQSLYELKKIGKLNNLYLSIAGTGEGENDLKVLCSKYGLEDIVQFHGWISGKEKEDLIMRSQAAILPSIHEGLPVSILEALSYGMPVIASDVGDVASAVIDGINGYLIQPGDVKQLERRLESVNDKKRFLQMSIESRNLAEKVFSEEKFFKTIIECYMRL